MKASVHQSTPHTTLAPLDRRSAAFRQKMLDHGRLREYPNRSDIVKTPGQAKDIPLCFKDDLPGAAAACRKNTA